MDPIFIWLISLLFIAIAIIVLLCIPEAGEALRKLGSQRYQKWKQRIALWHQSTSGRLARSGQRARERGVHGWQRLARNRLLLLAIGLLLVIPPLLVGVFHRHVMLDGFDVSNQQHSDTSALVASLLRGEQLVPPPALPPQVFTTPEVQMVRPDLGSASRDWVKLDPGFSQRLLAVFRIMKERYGYDMALIEGYRSPERQNELVAKGNNVTNAKAYQSYHQFGLAADCGFYRDGKLVISEKDPWAMRGYRLYGQVAAAAGLVWGGSWKMMDLGHVEWHKPGSGPHQRR